MNDWEFMDPSGLSTLITNNETHRQTIVTISNRDILKNSPSQLLNLMSKMIENALDEI